MTNDITFLFVRQVYTEMVTNGIIVPKEEVAPPTVPMDFNWARVSSELLTGKYVSNVLHKNCD